MKVYERNEDCCFTYPAEMECILAYLSERGKINVSASTVESLYRVFSDERYCTGWMSVIGWYNEHVLAEFEEWLTHVDF